MGMNQPVTHASACVEACEEVWSFGMMFPWLTSGKRQRRLWDAYAFPGFRPQTGVRGVFGDPKARVRTLILGSKEHCAASAVACMRIGTIARPGAT